MKEQYLIEQFESIREELDRWGKYVDEILREYCKSLSSPERLQIPPQHRIKDINSFIEKALYREKSKNYTNPLIDITDKVGTRIVLLIQTDVDKISKLIREEKEKWHVFSESQAISDIRLKDPEVFTYQSNHFIVKPKKNYFPTTEEKNDYLTCEIQVRTLLQHAYAEVSHDSVYKGHFCDDPIMKRTLATSMALMETTDNKFVDIYQKMSGDQTLFNKIKDKITEIYKGFNPLFIDSTYDAVMSELVFSILNENELKQIINNLEDFSTQEKDNIKVAINKKNYLLFTQPISILTLYLIKNHPSLTKKKWPFSKELLEESLRIMGFTTDGI